MYPYDISKTFHREFYFSRALMWIRAMNRGKNIYDEYYVVQNLKWVCNIIMNLQIILKYQENFFRFESWEWKT